MASQQQIGSYAFIAGVIIAIVAGLLAGAKQSQILGPVGDWIPLALVILGAIVGLLNVKDKETHNFLVAAIALGLTYSGAGGLARVPVIGDFLAGVVVNVAVFVAPAALIVALVAIHRHASEMQ